MSVLATCVIIKATIQCSTDNKQTTKSPIEVSYISVHQFVGTMTVICVTINGTFVAWRVLIVIKNGLSTLR